jgi:4'-phosphopantetheinyl transferase
VSGVLCWTPLAEPPGALPAEHEIHLWHADLGSTQADVSLLDAAELRRHGGMEPQRRKEFTVGRTVLRRLLGKYLCVSPGALRISVDASGKPRLEQPAVPLHFSLAHTLGHLLLAFAATPVGLDVEAPRPATNCLAIARRLFAAPQVELLERLSPPRRQQRFMQLWTAYEAGQKVHGAGIFGARTQASYTSHFMLDDETLGAVCIDSGAADVIQLRCFEFTG